jgi:hypothetical protein
MMLTAWSPVNDQEFLENVTAAKSAVRAPRKTSRDVRFGERNTLRPY